MVVYDLRKEVMLKMTKNIWALATAFYAATASSQVKPGYHFCVEDRVDPIRIPVCVKAKYETLVR